MAGVIDYPSIVADDVTPRDGITPRNMLGSENIIARQAFNFNPVAQTSPSTFVQETVQTMDQAKQNEQRLKDMMTENERLHKELALVLAKSQQAILYDRGRSPEKKKDDR